MTQTAKHTPGPWTYDAESGLIRAKITDSGEVTIASVRGWEKKWVREEKANAALIAAAPDMAEALQDALATIDALRADVQRFVEKFGNHGVYDAGEQIFNTAATEGKVHAALVKAGVK